MRSRSKLKVQLRRKIKLLLLLGFSFLEPPLIWATALGELAATMSGKSWAPLMTRGLTSALLDAGQGHYILQYTEDAVWDPGSRQFMFIGQGHNAELKHIVYNDEANTWREETRPTWVRHINHGYDHNAINTATGQFYFHAFNSTEVHRYDIRTKTWSRLPAMPDELVCCLGMEYFPELGGLVLAGGSKVYFYSDANSTWQVLATGLVMGPYHNFAEYNPVHKVMIFGGGNDSKDVYRLDRTGRITKMKPAPMVLGITQSIQTVDPVTGDYLVFGPNGKYYVYDITKDAWQLQTVTAPFGDANNTIASPISTYGVLMFLAYNNNNPKVFIYKHDGIELPQQPIRVGSNRLYKTPSEAAAVAMDGDVIEIDAGVYHKDAVVWTQNHLTIRGMGGRAQIQADGAQVLGKGTWVVQGDNTTIENIEFSGARVPDQNGAGIRLEGSGITLRNCYFHDNENGLLGPDHGGEVVIESCEFANNGFGDGYSHNLYILNASRLTIKFSNIHHAKIGHNIKSRAAENFILYNRIMDEADGTSSYAIDLPDGGTAYVIGNQIQQGPRTDNSTLISYGAESLRNGSNGFFLVNNTLVNDHSSGTFVRVASSAQKVLLMNNLWVGPGNVLSGPGEQKSNLATQEPHFVNRAAFDYHLNQNSPAIDAGTMPGSANGVSLTPEYHYVHPLASSFRRLSGKIDLGAFEFSPTHPSDDFIIFNAQAQDDQVVLSWTITDGNIYDVAIERKSNGGEFRQIGLVKSTESDQTGRTFIDDSGRSSMIFIYRLKLTAANGAVHYSREILIEINAPRDFRFVDNYPNPFHRMTTICFETLVPLQLSLDIYDVTGKTIQTIFQDKDTQPGRHTVPFGSADLPSGIYFLRLKKASQEIFVHKMLLVR